MNGVWGLERGLLQDLPKQKKIFPLKGMRLKLIIKK